MAKRAIEKNGYIIGTLDYGNLYMDQHKETLEAMMGHVLKRGFMWHIFHGIMSMVSWLGKKAKAMFNANLFEKIIKSMFIWKIHNGIAILQACDRITHT